ncbi:RNA-directed DNA polymerase, eukaryota [Tanacetum coccineum]
MSQETKKDDSQKGMLAKMRVPTRDESFSIDKRRGQSISVKYAGVISSALSNLQNFINDGSFLHQFKGSNQQKNDDSSYTHGGDRRDSKSEEPLSRTDGGRLHFAVQCITFPCENLELDLLLGLLGSVLLSNMGDRRVWDLNGDGVFRVKDVRNLLDETFLPKAEMPTRWIKCIPIKVNVFVWIGTSRTAPPTRLNLARRNVVTASLSSPVCDAAPEDTSHLFFSCSVAREVARSVCRWWDLGSHSFNSYAEWLVWFNSIRLGAKSKEVLEGIFYVS